MSLFRSEITSDDSLSLSLALGRFARSCFTTECCNNSREQTALIQSQPHSYQRVVSPGSLITFCPLGVICNRMRCWLLKPGLCPLRTAWPGCESVTSQGVPIQHGRPVRLGRVTLPANHRPVSARLTNERPGLVPPLVSRPGPGLTVPDTDDVPYQDIFHE